MTEGMTAEKRAEYFAEMAKQIELNKENAFGGAIVVVPADNAGDPIQLLSLDSSPDPATFWSMLQTKCAIQLEQLQDAARKNAAFMPRGR